MIGGRPLRVAALVKQVPCFEDMELGTDGRLRREGPELEMNPYCRRAVSKGVELARETGGACTIFTLGPPSAEDCLREAIAWGADDGVLITDPSFAGSDTLATARALAAALRLEGPFDLVLAGRNSVDADTGQVGPQIAQLLDLPFVAGVRELVVDDKGPILHVGCEQDDGWLECRVALPAVVSVAERLCEPCKVDPAGRAAVQADRLRVLTASDLGSGPWGQAGSPTSVGPVRVVAIKRARRTLVGLLESQVSEAVTILMERGALDVSATTATTVVPRGREQIDGAAVAVLVEPDRDRLTRELLGEAARLAGDLGGHVVAIRADGAHPNAIDPGVLASWGADLIIRIQGACSNEEVVAGVARWVQEEAPWAILTPSTAWGREVASRVAARIGAGLTGDAVELEVESGRLTAWKPAFGGQLVAAILCSSAVQMATVRPGALPLSEPRNQRAIPVRTIGSRWRRRVLVTRRTRDDDLDVLAKAAVVVGVGAGVPVEEYAAMDPLLGVLGAELAATRKVTDRGWMPHSRQVGITGRSISPRLYVAMGLSGKFNHLIGVRSAGTVLAINTDPCAPIFDGCDIGIVGDWRETLPLLAAGIAEQSSIPAG